MTRDEAIKEIQAWLDGCCGEECDPAREAFNMAISVLEQDTVSRTAYLQCARERDTAIEQLKELGYDFGEKIRTDGDTISRQAVLRALTNIKYNHCKTEGESQVIDTAKTLVNVMPAAHPEIIRCKDCKNWKRQVISINDGLGSCSFHNASFVTGEGYCYWAERREDG